MRVEGLVLHGGEAHGPVHVLSEPLSFWGAFDPRTGMIIDTHHPQTGVVLKGHILLLPETRGSGGTPGGIAEAVRLQTGPLGIIMTTPDINLAVGTQVAAALYGRACPVIVVTPADYDRLTRCAELTIMRDGTVVG